VTLRNSSFPDRHAQSEPGIREWRDLGPLLPASGITRKRIVALVRVRVSIPVEACLSMRPFTLRQRASAFPQIPTAGSTLLACIFKTALDPRLARSASRSRPRPVLTPGGARSMGVARYQLCL